MAIKVLISFFLLCFSFHGGSSTRLTVNNHCSFKIWPATFTANGPQVLTGFELDPKGTQSIDVPADWSGRVWGRTDCSGSAGQFSCASADCGSGQVECGGKTGVRPASLAEFTLNGSGQDNYDISLVDGFNVPISIAPSVGSCPTVSCPAFINNGCPDNLAVRRPDGGVVGCKSQCTETNSPQDCCTGEYNDPNKCKQSSISQSFKNQCPQAYTYAYDDPSSLVTCQVHPNDYTITFCP